MTVLDIPGLYDAHELCRFVDADFAILQGRMGLTPFEYLKGDYDSLISIPRHSPMVTLLISALLDQIERVRPDVIVANYLEPYGIAVAFVSGRTGIPYAVIHAGSDLSRLATSPSRQRAYESVLQEADIVLSSGSSARLAVDRGARPDSLVVDKPCLTPAQLFSPGGPVLPELETAPRGDLTIGLVGKLGRTKGSLELLRAVSQVVEAGIDVRIAVLTGLGSRSWEEFADLATHHGLDERVLAHHFVPHWLVGDFVRGCDVVAVLENRFPVATHRPQLPREIATCGVPLLISDEVFRYQPIRGSTATPGIFRVQDPQDHEELVRAVRTLASDDSLSEKGRANREIYDWPSEERLGSWLDSLLDRLQTAIEEKGARKVTMQRFQELSIRLISDGSFRGRAGSESQLMSADDLTQKERDALGYLIQDPNLERFAQSLLTKKFRFLTARFRTAFDRYPGIVTPLRAMFDDWPLMDEPLDEEFLRFAEWCIDRSTDLLEGAAEGVFRDWIRMALAEATCGVSSASVVPLSGDQDLERNRTLALLHLEHRLLDPEPGEADWLVAVWRDDREALHRMELSRPIYTALDELESPTSKTALVGRLGDLTGLGICEQTWGVVDELASRVMLAAAPASN